MPDPELQVNNVWAESQPTGAIVTMTLPSGQVVRAQRIPLEQLLMGGLVGEADQLISAIDVKHFNKDQEAAVGSLMKDPGSFGALMEIIDRALPLIVVEPTVELHMIDLPNPPPKGPKTKKIAAEDRKPDVIYTDQIGFQDKVDLINFGIGGLSDLVRFHQQPETAVAVVVDGQDVPHPPGRPAGNRQARRQRKPRSVRG